MKKTTLTALFMLFSLIAVYPQGTKITLGILNFDNNSITDNEKLEPLSKGMAAMLTTELQNIQAFKLVERQRLNDVLNELKLQQSGAVDPGTASKIGKIIGARAMLLGSFVNMYGKLRIDVRIVEVETGLTKKADEVTGDLDDLFDLIQQLTQKLPKKFDIELTDADREAIYSKRAQEKIDQTLLFSKGVDYEDIGRQYLKANNKDAAVAAYKNAISMYSDALKAAPNYAEAAKRVEDLNRLIVSIDIKENNTVAAGLTRELAITEPDISQSSDVTITEGMITVRGSLPFPNTYKDITVNGEKAVVVAEKEFYCNVKLKEGPNPINVKAVDEKGEAKEFKFTVTSKNDAGKPSIAILEPVMKRGLKIVKKSSVVKVRGIAANDVGVKEVMVNGKPAEMDAKGEFSSDVALAPGENKVLVRAIDKSGNVSEETVVINHGEETEATVTKNPNGRYALVIGNSDYKNSPLRNPVNDATAMAKSLKEMGFDVILQTNVATEKDMKRAIREFGKKLQTGGTGLFYYSGHGLQVKGVNYLVPVDADIMKEEDVEFEATDLNQVLAEMDFAKNPMNIVILDACRNNPYTKSTRSVAGGLASVNAPAGTPIAFSTSPGSVASDGTGQNGLYTEEFLTAMKTSGSKIEDVFKAVRANVRKKSNNEQIPWENTSLEGDFYFAKQ